jgi:hypothetical protein
MDYYHQMKTKFDYAADHPWESIAAVPLPPDGDGLGAAPAGPDTMTP